MKGGFQMDWENNDFDLDDLIFGPNHGPVDVESLHGPF